jgi:hypothetical protein
MAYNPRITKEQATKPVARTLKPFADTASHAPIRSTADSIQSIPANQASLNPAHIVQLQRTAGNRAVGTLLGRNYAQPPVIQAKKLGFKATRDHYETESNRTTEQKRPLPDQVKAGIESLSGLSMDDVNVHYNSPKPDQINALAYTQGTEIYLAPGEEKHLPHESWHLVQQAQGRVKPTIKIKQGEIVNDDARLEREADVMGQKALATAPQSTNAFSSQHQLKSKGLLNNNKASTSDRMRLQETHAKPQQTSVIQMEPKMVDGVEVDVGGGYTNWEGWHINWRLGSKKKGFEQYHLTSQDRTQHYFFIVNGSELEDTNPPSKLVPKRGTHGGLSKAPQAVQQFIRNNINELMG